MIEPGEEQDEKTPDVISNGPIVKDIRSTADIVIPKDPLKRVIGQPEAVELAEIAAKQRRHLLLVGPPGTGKSMIAQALALHLRRPMEEIRVVHNPENPERPLIQVRARDTVENETVIEDKVEGEIIDPKAAPVSVAEKLGYKCSNCGTYSSPKDFFCPKCSDTKVTGMSHSDKRFGDIVGLVGAAAFKGLEASERITMTRKRYGKEEIVVYERAGDMINVLDQETLENRRAMEKVSPSKKLVRLNRNPFVLSTGATETELLGDVRHDPYGSHPQLGTPPYERVVAGAIHEAHEGVLFIDELPHLGHLQRYILTAMQEKRFPINGRNPQSAGASVKVVNVPCNFIFVGACNIQDLEYILSPLRSRIIGSGYEVLVENTMENTEENRELLMQFIAQEIYMDTRIPHADLEAIKAIIDEAERRALKYDKKEDSLTLRLRELGGLIRSAGDIATSEKAEMINKDHIKLALKRSKPVEEQIHEKYGSYEKGVARDMSAAQRSKSPYHYWNEHQYDDKIGYG